MLSSSATWMVRWSLIKLIKYAKYNRVSSEYLWKYKPSSIEDLASNILNQVTILETIVAYNMLQRCLGFIPMLPHKLTLHIPSLAKCRNRNLAPSSKLSKRNLLTMSLYHLRLTSFCNGIATTWGSPNIQTQIHPCRAWVSDKRIGLASLDIDHFRPIPFDVWGLTIPAFDCIPRAIKGMSSSVTRAEFHHGFQDGIPSFKGQAKHFLATYCQINKWDMTMWEVVIVQVVQVRLQILTDVADFLTTSQTKYQSQVLQLPCI